MSCKKLPMRFAHIFFVPETGTGSYKLIAAGSGFYGCATATDLHRDSLLKTINMGVNISKFSANANAKTKFFQKFFKKN